MRKAFCIKFSELVLGIIFTGCLFVSCGLDTYEVLDSPEHTEHVPEQSEPNYEESYFAFYTNEANSSSYSTVFFLGTAIYYKIYTNYSTMKAESDALKTLADSEDSSANAPTRLISGYAYQPLKASNSTESVLIPRSGTQQKVYVRLTDYQDEDAWSARIEVDDAPIGGGTERSVPLRFVDGLSFNFGRMDTDSEAKVPASSDADVRYSSFTVSGLWYVAMFAVGVAMDANYTNQYSNILYLGHVCIDQNSRDN